MEHNPNAIINIQPDSSSWERAEDYNPFKPQITEVSSLPAIINSNNARAILHNPAYMQYIDSFLYGKSNWFSEFTWLLYNRETKVLQCKFCSQTSSNGTLAVGRQPCKTRRIDLIVHTQTDAHTQIVSHFTSSSSENSSFMGVQASAKFGGNQFKRIHINPNFNVGANSNRVDSSHQQNINALDNQEIQNILQTMGNMAAPFYQTPNTANMVYNPNQWSVANGVAVPPNVMNLAPVGGGINHSMSTSPMMPANYSYGEVHPSQYVNQVNQAPSPQPNVIPEFITAKILKELHKKDESLANRILRNYNLREDWFAEFSWLMYNTKDDCFYCKYCRRENTSSVFSRGKTAKSDSSKRWDFVIHSETDSHKNVMALVNLRKRHVASREEARRSSSEIVISHRTDVNSKFNNVPVECETSNSNNVLPTKIEPNVKSPAIKRRKRNDSTVIIIDDEDEVDLAANTKSDSQDSFDVSLSKYLSGDLDADNVKYPSGESKNHSKLDSQLVSSSNQEKVSSDSIKNAIKETESDGPGANVINDSDFNSNSMSKEMGADELNKALDTSGNLIIDLSTEVEDSNVITEENRISNVNNMNGRTKTVGEEDKDGAYEEGNDVVAQSSKDDTDNSKDVKRPGTIDYVFSSCTSEGIKSQSPCSWNKTTPEEKTDKPSEKTALNNLRKSIKKPAWKKRTISKAMERVRLKNIMETLKSVEGGKNSKTVDKILSYIDDKGMLNTVKEKDKSDNKSYDESQGIEETNAMFINNAQSVTTTNYDAEFLNLVQNVNFVSYKELKAIKKHTLENGHNFRDKVLKYFRLQSSWFTDFHWLQYDVKQDLLFCELCRSAKTKSRFSSGVNCRNLKRFNMLVHSETNSHKQVIIKSDQPQMYRLNTKKQISIPKSHINQNKNKPIEDNEPSETVTISSIKMKPNSKLKNPSQTIGTKKEQIAIRSVNSNGGNLSPLSEDLEENSDQGFEDFENYSVVSVENNSASNTKAVDDANSYVPFHNSFWQMTNLFREENILCDITLAAISPSKIVTKFPAHKIILIAASSLLRQKIMSRPNVQTLVFPNVSVQGLKGVLDYLYGQNIVNGCMFYVECYKTACALDIPSAKVVFKNLLRSTQMPDDQVMEIVLELPTAGNRLMQKAPVNGSTCNTTTMYNTNFSSKQNARLVTKPNQTSIFSPQKIGSESDSISLPSSINPGDDNGSSESDFNNLVLSDPMSEDMLPQTNPSVAQIKPFNLKDNLLKSKVGNICKQQVENIVTVRYNCYICRQFTVRDINKIKCLRIASLSKTLKDTYGKFKSSKPIFRRCKECTKYLCYGQKRKTIYN